MDILSLIRQQDDHFQTICTPIKSKHGVHYIGERKSFTEILCFLLGVLSKPGHETGKIYRQIDIETKVLLHDNRNVKKVEIFQCRHSHLGEKDIFQPYVNTGHELIAYEQSEDSFTAVESFLDPKLGYGRITLHLFPFEGDSIGNSIEEIARSYDQMSQGAFTAGLNAVPSPKAKP